MSDQATIRQDQRSEQESKPADREHLLDEMAGMLGAFVFVLFLASVIVFGSWKLWITLEPSFGTLAHSSADWMVRNLFVSCYVGFALTVPFGVGSLVNHLSEGKQPASLRGLFLNKPCTLAGRAGAPILAAHAVRVACASALVFAISFWVVRDRQRRLEAVGAHAVALGRRLLLWASVAAGFPCLVVVVVAPSAVRTNSMFLVVLAIVVLAISGALWATRLAAPVR